MFLFAKAWGEIRYFTVTPAEGEGNPNPTTSGVSLVVTGALVTATDEHR